MNLHPLLRNVLAGITLTLSAAASAEVQMLDRIVAIVDSTTVPQSELDRRLNEVVGRAQNAGVQLPSLSVVREQVLNQLISETLQLNMANRYGVETSDEEVNTAVQNIMNEQNLNEMQLIQGLRAEGLTLNEFKENLRRQQTLQTIARGVVSSRIRVSEQDIDNFLQSADAKFWASPEYHLQHILIPVSGSGTGAVEAAQNKANEVHQKLVDGADFTAIAIAESKGPAALNGGDLGIRKTSELPTLFADIAPTLEINGIAKPARSRAGFHILKLLDKRGETKQMVTQSKVRHILIEPNEILNKEEARQRISDLRQQILDGGDFENLAKLHTDDIGSKMTGGDMGWSSPGLFVPEFEAAMDAAEIGVVTEPVFTQFGWHIIEVMDRREEDLSDEVIRQKAKHFLIGRRFEDEVQLWLQEMRDEAFIETKI